MSKMLHKWVVLALLFSLSITSLQGQETCEMEEESCCAYSQGCQTAHWSIYIPITILVVAAIWFGVSDRSHSSSSSGDSQDALGSIDNSKRNAYRRENPYYSQSNHSSRGCYCHH